MAAVVAGAGLGSPATANATTTTTASVYASDDAYTSSTRRTTNFGQADKLVVGRASGETRMSYLKFTVKDLPADTTLAGVRLKLPLASKPPASTLTLMRVPSTAWSETTLTAARAPGASGTVGTLKLSATTTVATFDVTKVVTKPGVYSFALKSSATSAVTRLRSVEYGTPTTGGPELLLTLKKTSTTAPAPITPAPAPVVPAPTTPAAPQRCLVDTLLVPSCGVLWGAAAGGFTDTPRDQALKDWEALTGRTASIFHQYHKGDEKFPTKAEIAMTRDPAKPRVLLLNWKVAYGTTWAAVARGEKNARIDNWAAYVKATYPEKFFLALHHEPENDVKPTVGSGMTAKDYAAMYRHVITRLRANGVTNAINVLAYMGNEKWLAQSWWSDLYPGDDVVDWIGLDSYVSAEPGYYHYGMFADLLDRRPTGGGTGFYDWATTAHPTKPIMVAEWGVYHRTTHIVDKSPAFASVAPELRKRPAIKAIVYFDTERDDEGDRNISVGSTPQGLATFRDLAADPMFNVDLR
jgi:hypothetical protein